MEKVNIWIPLLLTFLAGVSTALGSFISLFVKRFERSYLRFSLGLSAGVMVYVSFIELLPSAIENTGFLRANLAFFVGIFFIMLIDFIVPHEYMLECTNIKECDRRLMSAGVFTAIGLAIHNFPEGLAVFMSSIGDVRLGVALAVAIALHNIPEGIAVSMPIVYATGSKKKAFWYSFLSGIAEPVGAVIGVLILMPFLNQTVLSLSLAFVAGIMVFISFDELLPLCYEGSNDHTSIAGVIVGMFMMALSLHLL